MPNLFTIDLNTAPEEKLREIGLAQIKGGLELSELVRTELKEAATDRNSAEEKLSAQQERLSRAKGIFELKFEKYRKAEEVRNSIQDKTDTLFSDLRLKLQHERSLVTRLSNLEAKVASVQDVYSETAIQAKLLMLKSLSEAIDTHHGIEYRTFQNGRATLAWTTRPIRIKDGIGGWTETTFGPFCVVISSTNNNGISGISVDCRHVDFNYDMDEDDEYYNSDEDGWNNIHHPHISGGNVCLGNAQQMMLEAVKRGDIAEVIMIFTDFLQTYNKQDPYRALLEWEPNGHDNAVENGQLVANLTEYPENSCSSCGCEENELSACGHCLTCCLKYHVHDPGSSGVGINGSECLERSLYSISRSLEEEESNGESND